MCKSKDELVKMDKYIVLIVEKKNDEYYEIGIEDLSEYAEYVKARHPEGALTDKDIVRGSFKRMIFRQE